MTGAAKSLRLLLEGIATLDVASDRLVQGLALDSREVTPGCVFLAVPGLQHDGRAFIEDAVARGAAAVVYEAGGVAPRALSVPAVAVADLLRNVSAIADRFYDAPSRQLVVVGVTGTNGKTTCTQLLAQALDQTGSRASAFGSLPSPSGRGNEGEGRFPHPLPSPEGRGGVGDNLHFDRPRRCAIIGTLGYGFPGALDAGLHTTPDAITVQRLLAGFVAARAAYTAMEVSSHALDQHRVRSVSFHTAVFTNLTRDHLDYHGDMDRYAAAKGNLFTGGNLRAAVINRDDEYGRKLVGLLAERRTPVITYGLSAGDVHARTLTCTREGLRLRAVTPRGEVAIDAPLFGSFNASNLLAGLATLLALGLELQDAGRRLSGVRPVPGRVERFKGADDQPLVVVDYAHTPDALEQVLLALRPHVTGRLWCVFGCGGNRDRGKRPAMGAIAERLADTVILTDDNPRHEAGETIIREIAAGMHKPPRVMRERPSAIAAAIAEASAEDVVLIAGKGHEDYQEIAGTRHPYSDRETVRSLLGLAA